MQQYCAPLSQAYKLSKAARNSEIAGSCFPKFVLYADISFPNQLNCIPGTSKVIFLIIEINVGIPSNVQCEENILAYIKVLNNSVSKV